MTDAEDRSPGDGTDGRDPPGPRPRLDPDRLEQTGLDDARGAVGQVRREVRKATLIYAVVDAAVVAALVNLTLAVVVVPGVPETVSLPVPETVASALQLVTGAPITALAITGGGAAAVAAGILTAAIEYWRLRRRGPVEWFERANPEVSEALRTTRDVSEDDEDDLMARILYRDVLDRLRTTSSVRLVDVRRLAAAVVLVVAASLLAAQVSLAGLSIDVGPVAPNVSTGGAGGGVPPPGGGTSAAGEGSGLGAARDVLGEPENVDRGSVDVPVEIATGGAGGDPEDRPYEASGFPSDASTVDAQEAGFAPPEDLEDADIVREYNVRIREVTENDTANRTRARAGVTVG